MTLSDTRALQETPVATPDSAQTPPSSRGLASDTPDVARRLAALESQIQDLDSRVENNRLVHDSWTLIVFAVAVVALLASIIAIGFGMRAIDEAERKAQSSLGATAAAVLAT